MVLQVLANGIILGLAYALIALGFGLIYSTTRIFNFAHGAIYTLTAYTFYTFYVSLGLNVVLAATLSLGLAAATSIMIDKFIFLPLVDRGSSLLIPLLSSLGLYITMINLIAIAYGNDFKTISPGLQPSYYLGGVLLTRIQLVIAGAFILLFCALILTLRKTNLGQIVRAMRDDPQLLIAMGVDPQRTRWTIFALGSVLSGVAAILIGIDVGIDPHIGMIALLNGAVAVIIGGVGVFEGAAVGALVLGLLQSIVVWYASARWADAISFVALICFLLVRPEGITGRRRRLEEVAQ